MPPTEVTHGSDVGNSVWARVVVGSQFAPVDAASRIVVAAVAAENWKPMPSIAPA